MTEPRADAEIALSKWGAAQLGVSDWRTVKVEFDVDMGGCPTCGPDWPALEIRHNGRAAKHVALYEFQSVLGEILAVEITDEDRLP